ncbi:MAG TPA: hypothetical protein ENH82_05265 [bacterium]|nr:hypothetical protein [bacterium]
MKDIDRLAEYFRDHAYGFLNRKTKGRIMEFLESWDKGYSERQVRLLIEKLRKERGMAIVSNSKITGYFLFKPGEPESIVNGEIMVKENNKRKGALSLTNAPVERALRGDRPIVLDKEWIKRDIERDIESAEQLVKEGVE